MGQRDRILRMLTDAYPDGICGTVFLRELMPRYSARIWELRAAGWDIQTERCRVHTHDTRQTLYRLVSLGQCVGKFLPDTEDTTALDITGMDPETAQQTILEWMDV